MDISLDIDKQSVELIVALRDHATSDLRGDAGRELVTGAAAEYAKRWRRLLPQHTGGERPPVYRFDLKNPAVRTVRRTNIDGEVYTKRIGRPRRKNPPRYGRKRHLREGVRHREAKKRKELDVSKRGVFITKTARGDYAQLYYALFYEFGSQSKRNWPGSSDFPGQHDLKLLKSYEKSIWQSTVPKSLEKFIEKWEKEALRSQRAKPPRRFDITRRRRYIFR